MFGAFSFAEAPFSGLTGNYFTASLTVRFGLVPISASSDFTINGVFKWSQVPDGTETWNQIADSATTWTPIQTVAESWTRVQ